MRSLKNQYENAGFFVYKTFKNSLNILLFRYRKIIFARFKIKIE